MYAADITKFKLSYALYQIIERDLKKTDLISIAIDSATATEIKKESHIYFPTTGFNTILYIIKTCNPKKEMNQTSLFYHLQNKKMSLKNSSNNQAIRIYKKGKLKLFFD